MCVSVRVCICLCVSQKTVLLPDGMPGWTSNNGQKRQRCTGRKRQREQDSHLENLQRTWQTFSLENTQVTMDSTDKGTWTGEYWQWTTCKSGWATDKEDRAMWQWGNKQWALRTIGPRQNKANSQRYKMQFNFLNNQGFICVMIFRM